ncbi:hypothetical protein LB505_006626 [Fusarium chuoi]|nr:hypothetical protein LB505_006626 [Fusarium chuoi]
MKRETQRMSRNMQLVHEAKTRKKITKNSLFERFNFRPAGEPEPDVASSSRVPTPHSDVEMQGVDTPPSSPPVSKETATATAWPRQPGSNQIKERERLWRLEPNRNSPCKIRGANFELNFHL